MTESTVRIVQRCTTEEAAAMVAAITAFEQRNPGAAPAQAATAIAAGAGTAAGSSGAPRREGGSVLWNRSEYSLGRGF